MRDSLIVDYTLHDKRIEIVEGDLTNPGEGEDVDVMVVSAFPGDYAPTEGSLVGALQGKGLSVAELSTRREFDLTRDFSCWLSESIRDTHPALRAGRILCFEPQNVAQDPADAVDHIFRALAPFIGAHPQATSVAMSMVACGDQNVAVEAIVEPLVRSAVRWMRSSPLQYLRIVERSPERAERMRQAFALVKGDIQREQAHEDKQYDVFLSYCHTNSRAADMIVQTLRTLRPSLRIFRDVEKLRAGQDYHVQLDRAVRSSRRVVPVYSPAYIGSTSCQTEFNDA